MSFNLSDLTSVVSGLSGTQGAAATGSNTNQVGNLITTGLNAYNTLKPNTPTGYVTASPVLNNSYNFNIPDYSKETAINLANAADYAKSVTGSVTVNATTDSPKKDNTVLYVGIGGAVLVVIVIIFFMFKKK